MAEHPYALIAEEDGKIIYKDCWCGMWSCELCRPKLKRKVQAFAWNGEPSTLLSATRQRVPGETPAEHMDALFAGWQKAKRKLRRDFPKVRLEYLYIVERHKSGYAHLHVLCRAPYIPQKVLSGIMRYLFRGQVVDIRKVHNPRQVIAYVAKYLTKEPAKFPGHHIYGRSHGWLDTETAQEAEAKRPPRRNWRRVRCTVSHLDMLYRWTHDITQEGELHVATAHAPPRGSPQEKAAPWQTRQCGDPSFTRYDGFPQPQSSQNARPRRVPNEPNHSVARTEVHHGR